jgi:hypothetical protein
VNTATLAQQREDVATTITALQEWRDRLRHEIKSHSGAGAEVPASASDVAQAINQVEAEVRDLHAQVIQQQAQRRALQQQRDVLLESFSSLSKKSEEGRVARLVGADKEVVVAGHTTPEPAPRRFTVVLPLAALLGTVIAAAWFLMTDWILPLARESRIAVNPNGAVGAKTPTNNSRPAEATSRSPE